MTDRKHNDIFVQATVLAAAGFISRIIGLLYRSPLAAVLGDLGSGYYQGAYQIYTIVLLISSYSIPSAISKVIAQKLAVKEYRNAHRIFLCSVVYVLVIGTLASLFLYFGAGLLVDGNAVPVLRVFAPTVFVYGLLGVLRGYFQAHKSMVQTSVSQILEQIANAVVSIAAAVLLIRVFTSDPAGNSAVLRVLGYGRAPEASVESLRAMYGAIGSAMGTGAGVLVGLLFVWTVYRSRRKKIHERIREDQSGKVDSVGQIFRTISGVVVPFLLSTAAYNLSTALNSTLYLKLYRSVKHLEEETVYSNYGIFAYKAVTICNIPVAFASAMASAMLPSMSELMATKDLEGAREKIHMATKTTMLIAIPSAVGLMVLAKPVTWLLFPQAATIDRAAGLLAALAVTVIFFCLSTLSSSILQGIGKVNAPIYNAATALVVQTVLVITALCFTGLDLYALVLANIVYSGLMCLLNQRAVRKAVDYHQELKGTFLLPLLAAAVMGVAARVVYRLLLMATDSMVISLFPAVVVAVGVYFAALLLFKGVTEEELKAIPKGRLLIRIAKKCRLLRG